MKTTLYEDEVVRLRSLSASAPVTVNSKSEILCVGTATTMHRSYITE
jgi:hypothetical protein